MRKTVLAITLSLLCGAVYAVPSSKENVEQVEVKLTFVPFEQLGINQGDPRFNMKQPLSFALKEQGYFPLTGMMLSKDLHNPFSLIEVLHGYYLAKGSVVTKNDVALTNKLIDTNYRYDALNDWTADLVLIVKDKSYLLGEYVTSSEIANWIDKDSNAGRERVYSNLLKLQHFFAAKNAERDRSDVAIAKKMAAIYKDVRNMLSDVLKQNLDVDYYLKSVLYQDEDTRQIAEVLLLNSLDEEAIGQVTAAADVLIAAMGQEKLPVVINKHAKKSTNVQTVKINTDFVGEYYRVYSPQDAVAAQLGILDSIIIKPNKEQLNVFDVTLNSGVSHYQAMAKLNRAGRGIEFELNNPTNDQDFYAELKDDTLLIYADPNSGSEKVFTFKRDKVVAKPNDSLKFALEKPKYDTAIDPKNVDLSVFKPSNVLSHWVADAKGTADLDSLIDSENYYKTKGQYGLSLYQKTCTDLSCVKLDRFVIVDSKFADDDTMDCDLIKQGAAIVQIPLNNKLTGYLSFNENLSNTYPKLSTTIPYSKNGNSGNICMVAVFEPNLGQHPENIVESVKLFNTLIHQATEVKQ